jgi:hypothetical protein
MKISDIFNPDRLSAEFLQITPITLRDKKGKEVKADGTPDVLPVVMSIPLELRSYQYTTDQGPRIQYAIGLLPYITQSGQILETYVREYFSAAQLILADLLGITKEQMEGADGFQLRTDDPRISEDTLDQLYDGLNKQYPLGPVVPEMIKALNDCAEALLGSYWEQGDNYKVYISYLVIKAIGQYAATCQHVVEQQVAGPVFQILQYRMEQQMAASQKPGAAITDVFGSKLNSKGAGKIVGLDGREIKKDEIVN